MKKAKLLGFTLALLGTASMLAACGSKKGDMSPQFDQSGETTITKSAATKEFGKKSEEEYPISDDVQKKLDALTTDYSKVNWEAEYMPTDGIVVSEGTFIDTHNTIKAERYHLVVAFTNTTDQNIRLSLDGNVEDVEGAYVQDIFTDEIEIWAGNTVAISLKLLEKIPSGNIKWNKFEIQPLDKEYIPYEVSTELQKGDTGSYALRSDASSDNENTHSFRTTTYCGLILDKDGKILCGEGLSDPEDTSASWHTVSLHESTFGGENADFVFFVNLFL